jgi:hypothetical protein
MYKTILAIIVLIIAMFMGILLAYSLINNSQQEFFIHVFSTKEYVSGIISKYSAGFSLIMLLTFIFKFHFLNGPSIVFKKKLLLLNGNKIKIYILSDGNFIAKGKFTIDEYNNAIIYHVKEAMDSEEVKDKIMYYKIKKKYYL